MAMIKKLPLWGQRHMCAEKQPPPVSQVWLVRLLPEPEDTLHRAFQRTM